jgi:hypothetical protein
VSGTRAQLREIGNGACPLRETAHLRPWVIQHRGAGGEHSGRSGDREGPREHPPLVVALCGARSAAGQTGQVADKDVVALL